MATRQRDLPAGLERWFTSSGCCSNVFYIHGGGFAKGDLAAFHHLYAAYSTELNALVAFPLYGLCHAFPLFQDLLPEAREAIARVRTWLDERDSSRAAPCDSLRESV